MPSISRRATLAVLATGALAVGASTTAGASTNSKAQALLNSALAHTRAAKSVTVSGVGSSSGQSVKISVTAGANAAYGVLTYGGQATTLRRVGTKIYAKGTKGFLEQQGASSSQAAVEANKWFQIPSSETTNYQSLQQFLVVKQVLTGLIPSSVKGTISGVKNSTLNGQAVEVISGTFSGQKGSLYVNRHGTPYLLRVVQNPTSSGGGTITLSNFNKPVHTTTPKGAVTQ
jgi:hypothetical protein